MTLESSSQPDFDFDEMARLAKTDPEAFELRRQEMLARVIDEASPAIRRRMQGLQWQIDQVRDNSANPMASCIRISKMMWDSVLDEDGLLDSLQRLQNGQVKERPKDGGATVIPLRDNKNEAD